MCGVVRACASIVPPLVPERIQSRRRTGPQCRGGRATLATERSKEAVSEEAPEDTTVVATKT